MRWVTGNSKCALVSGSTCVGGAAADAALRSGTSFPPAAGACGILATWPVFQFLLDTEVILYGDRLVLRTLGRLRSPVSVPLSDVREISVGPSHAYTLRVQLRDGRIVTVGPWGAEARRTQGLLPSE